MTLQWKNPRCKFTIVNCIPNWFTWLHVEVTLSESIGHMLRNNNNFNHKINQQFFWWLSCRFCGCRIMGWVILFGILHITKQLLMWSQSQKSRRNHNSYWQLLAWSSTWGRDHLEHRDIFWLVTNFFWYVLLYCDFFFFFFSVLLIETKLHMVHELMLCLDIEFEQKMYGEIESWRKNS